MSTVCLNNIHVVCLKRRIWLSCVLLHRDVGDHDVSQRRMEYQLESFSSGFHQLGDKWSIFSTHLNLQCIIVC